METKRRFAFYQVIGFVIVLWLVHFFHDFGWAETVRHTLYICGWVWFARTVARALGITWFDDHERRVLQDPG